MDICNKYDLSGQNCLYVTDIDDSYTTQEISDFFEVNGQVKNVVKVPNEPGEQTGRVLIEYTSDRAITRIDPSKLGYLESPKDPSVTWHVRTIREICQDELGRELAQRYLNELQTLHSTSRAGFLDTLQRELETLQSDVSPSTEGEQPSSESLEANQTLHYHHVATKIPPDPNNIDVGGAQDGNYPGVPLDDTNHSTSQPRLSGTLRTPSHIDESVLNPPQVQKLVVEHIMRSDTLPSSYSQSRIRTFSGRLPKPSGEVDYDAWCAQVDLLLWDPSLSENQKTRRILESLLSPAADIVKPLGTRASPRIYLEHLEAAFGVVEDGEELFATFLSSNQNSGEKPSAYLNRLHVLLTKAISRGGVSASDSEKHLLRQFCRGCWDQALIVGLQLEHKRNNPPSFSELLLLLRTEEDRRSAKLDRMRKHLGNTKAASYAHSVFSMSADADEPAPVASKTPDSTQRLAKEVAELRKQVAALTKKETGNIKEPSSCTSPVQSGSGIKNDCLIASAANPQPTLKATSYPRPWFCFKCGQDGHIAAKCNDEPNPALVRKKNTELKARREKFQTKQGEFQQTLNW